MCGRFYVDDDTMQEIERIARKIDREKRSAQEVAPTQKAMIIHALENEIVSRFLQWGYERDKKKGVIFNARSETVQQRSMFAADFEMRRCVIPASGFYEWKSNGTKEKERYEFYVPQKTLFMAGIFHRDPAGDRFTILTQAADGCMEKIHDRMPVLLRKQEIDSWLFSKKEAAKMLSRSFEELRGSKSTSKAYEQLRLF